MADLISAMQAIYTYVISIFATAFSTIQNNPVLYLPILIGIAGGIILYVVRLIRKLGVRGVRGR